MRIGFASDIHRLVSNRKLILGGVIIPFSLGEEAHSDGDVVYHALAESILGALALGDLGTFFPDTDDTTKDLDSSLIVKKAVELMKLSGFEVNNIDISIFIEKPKIRDYIKLIKENIANIVETNDFNVSIKACTNEGIGCIGKSQAVKATCVILLKGKGE